MPAGAVLVDPSACAAMSAKAGCEAVLSLAVAGLTLMTVERALPKSLNQHRKSLASLAAGVACVAMACALNPPAVRYVVNPFDLAPHHWFALYLAKTAVRARRQRAPLSELFFSTRPARV